MLIMLNYIMFLLFLWSSVYITPEWLFQLTFSLLTDGFMELHLQYLNSTGHQVDWCLKARSFWVQFQHEPWLKTLGYLETKSLTWCTLLRWRTTWCDMNFKSIKPVYNDCLQRLHFSYTFQRFCKTLCTHSLACKNKSENHLKTPKIQLRKRGFVLNGALMALSCQDYSHFQTRRCDVMQ